MTKEKNMKEIWNQINELCTQMPAFYNTYLKDCMNRGLSPKTILAYEYEHSKFFLSCLNNVQNVTCKQLERILPKEIHNYIYQNGEYGNARALSAIRHLYRFLYSTEQINNNPALLVKTPQKKNKNLSDFSCYKLQDTEKMCNKIKNGDGLTEKQKQYLARTMFRDQAILTFIQDYRLTTEQITQMEIDNLDLNTKTFHGFGRKMQLTEAHDELLRNYILEERRPLTDYEPALFIGSRTSRDRLSVRTVEKIVKKYTGMSSVKIHHLQTEQYKEI